MVFYCTYTLFQFSLVEFISVIQFNSIPLSTLYASTSMAVSDDDTSIVTG